MLLRSRNANLFRPNVTPPAGAPPNQIPTISLAVSATVVASGGSVTLTATVADPDGTVPFVQFLKYGGNLGAPVAVTGGTTATKVDAAADGLQVYTAIAIDNLGAESAVSNSRSVQFGDAVFIGNGITAQVDSGSTGMKEVDFAFTFAPGAVPNYAALQGESQLKPVTLGRYPDGSLRKIKVGGLTSLSTSPRTIRFIHSTTDPNVGTPLSLASIAANPLMNASVQCGSIGTRTLGSLFGLGFPFVKLLWATPDFIEAIYAGQVGGDIDLFAYFYVKMFSNGNGYIRPMSSLAFIDDVDGSGMYFGRGMTDRIYVPTFTVNGVVVYNNGGVSQTHAYQTELAGPNPRQGGWVGTNPLVLIKRDKTEHKATKSVPNFINPYNVALTEDVGVGGLWGFTSTDVNEPWVTTYSAGRHGNTTGLMNATGQHPHLGLLPMWDANCIESDYHPKMQDTSYANAACYRSYPICYRERATLHPVRPTQYPNWSWMGPNQGNMVRSTHDADGIEIDWNQAHSSSNGYLASEMSGDPFFFETVAFAATADYLFGQASYGLGTQRLALSVFSGRTTAWYTRDMAAASANLPDQMFANLRQDFRDLSYWNLYWHYTCCNDPDASRMGFTFMPVEPQTGLWMWNWVPMAVGFARDLNYFTSAQEPVVDFVHKQFCNIPIGCIGLDPNRLADYCGNYFPGANTIGVQPPGTPHPNWYVVANNPREFYDTWDEIGLGLPTVPPSCPTTLEWTSPQSAMRQGFTAPCLLGLAAAVDAGATNGEEGYYAIHSYDNSPQLYFYGQSRAWMIGPRKPGVVAAMIALIT